MAERPAAYVIKAAIADPEAGTFVLPGQKSMYGGRRISVGDTVYLFASETSGGSGLIAKCAVTAAAPVPPRPGIARQTPRVDVTLTRIATAKRPCGRSVLKSFRDWDDGRPETELNFKFYRQATDKIGGISPTASSFLNEFF